MLKAIEILKVHLSMIMEYSNGSGESNRLIDSHIEAIKELEQSQKNFNELWDKFCKTNDNLYKAKAYIIDLENQLKAKEDNGWMRK